MDTELHCNNLSCRRLLTDKAVVTTCSHIFDINCANDLFGSAQICPACETSLAEPDDVVICSLHPTNDYKTSVLAGLSPSTILDICGRAIAFWQYQIHQENAFQQALVRNVSDTNSQMEKKLENVIREANSEIGLMGTKLSSLERDMELERRKNRELQDASRDRDKEYQKLKNQYDKIKRKVLLGGNLNNSYPEAQFNTAVQGFNPSGRLFANNDRHNHAMAGMTGVGMNSGGSLSDVVGGMEATGIQRTPIRGLQQNNSGLGQGFGKQPWQKQNRSHAMQSFYASDVSDNSANEVEALLGHHQSSRSQRQPLRSIQSGMRSQMHAQKVLPPSTHRQAAGFRPV